jgi:1-acyl-sn-glycerol-3-phosphate acyltransferase
VQTRSTDRIFDVAVTLICWLYFTLGFVIFFSPFYIAAYFLSSQPEKAIQRYTRFFFRGFFAILQRLSPRQKWVFDKNINNIRSSVVVCNHLSYLDPLLMIAQLDRAKTIVKSVFFSVPIFGWVLRAAGFFPATATGKFGAIMLKQMDNMQEYLAEGGNLFIFPEGTRSRNGRVGPLNQGALKIARHCQAPIYVLCIKNTDRLFTPGKFFFFTRRPNIISMSIVDHIAPDYQNVSLADLTARVRQRLEDHLQEETAHRERPADIAGCNCGAGA